MPWGATGAGLGNGLLGAGMAVAVVEERRWKRRRLAWKRGGIVRRMGSMLADG